MRLAASYHVAREDFLLNYDSSNSTALGIRVSKLSTRAGRSGRRETEAHRKHSIGYQCARSKRTGSL